MSNNGILMSDDSIVICDTSTVISDVCDAHVVIYVGNE